MCGRLNIIDDPLAEAVSACLGITFFPQTNRNLCPSENVSVIAKTGYSIHQHELRWGIKPHWANRLIINAQAETVASKPTFSSAYRHNRVVVPCSGWYEWKKQDVGKQRYLFDDPDGRPLYMAGVALENNNKLVTLTTEPNRQCVDYHHRMPLLISENCLELWLHGDAEEAIDLLERPYRGELRICSV